MWTSKIFLAIAFLFFSFCAFSQKGRVRGSVTDAGNGEMLLGATVLVKQNMTGSTTDLDGKFEIQLDPGVYDLQISFVTYRTVTITGVEIKAGEVTILDPVSLSEEVSELQEVVIAASAIRTTESALLTVKKKSANVMDGISSESFRRIGATDAAAAATKVPGVSVQGGKYVFVRGLGDRYTKTTLNNMEVPGLDPDRNTIQLDLFPTNILSNIIVFKSFTADLPADFTGGIVNIEPNEFPEEKSLRVSLSLGVNPDMHFNSNYLTSNTSQTDFLGFDDGTRKLPLSSVGDTPPPVGDNKELTRITRRFDPAFGTRTATSLPNLNMSVSFGNQVAKGEKTIGYNGAISYQNTTTFLEGVQSNNIFIRNNDFSTNNLDTARYQTGSEGNNNVILSGLAGFALKTKLSKYSLSALHIQNGESSANIYDQRNLDGNSNRSIRHVVAYSERSITNFLIAGENHFGDSKWSMDWKLAPTFSTIADKDVRLTPFTMSEGGELSIEPSEGGNPQRLWRYLNETNYSGKIDVVKDFRLKERASKLKIGASGTLKQRDFTIDNFDFLVANQDDVDLNGNPDNLLLPENIYDNGTGTYVRASYQGSNSYEASIRILGLYVSTELALAEKLKAILGIRGESYLQKYTGGDQDYFNSDGAQGIFLNDEKVLDSFKPFPTANFIYSAKDNANIRLSYARTIARPSFREKSIAQIIDPISASTWIGNIDLDETDIDNLDLRWEEFYTGGQTLAFSTFYKRFSNPIEVQVYSPAAPSSFTARNNGDATVYGIELEGRKTLDFISEALANFTINANVSFIKSSLTIGEAERADREANKREGEEIKTTRVMQGQSPYLVNFGLNYLSADASWDGGIFYNVQGPALGIVGVGNVADIYNMPFHSVNVSLKKNFGEDKKSSLQFRVANLLNDKVESAFRAYEATDRIQSSRAPGRIFTLAFGYSF